MDLVRPVTNENVAGRHRTCAAPTRVYVKYSCMGAPGYAQFQTSKLKPIGHSPG